jgi:hypothetical protein
LSAHRRRLTELDEERAEAADHHNEGRLARLEPNGRRSWTNGAPPPAGGRAGALGADATERGRKAVNNRITREIKRIAEALPGLGARLSRSVTTGSTPPLLNM